MSQTPAEGLQGEIWSKSLKYLDLVAHYKPETSEHYYMYRDDKARELALDVMELVTAYAATVEREARIDEGKYWKSDIIPALDWRTNERADARLAALQGPQDGSDGPSESAES
jgi:hypothetical protein